MKCTEITLEQAISQGLALPYAYITRLSTVTVGLTPGEFSTDELIDARFFGPAREVHIYTQDSGLAAVLTEDGAGDDCLDSSVRVRDSRFGKTLAVRRYLGYDSDGQAYIQATRLLRWEGISNG